MISYQEFKNMYYSNIILFVILLFVIIYSIINWEQIYTGKYLSGQFVKPILITGILSLIFHMLITWDENLYENNTDSELKIPKYKLSHNNNKLSQNSSSKYKIANKFDNLQSDNLKTIFNANNENKNITNTPSKMSNQNIFISHKNSSKYGLKF